MKPLIVSFHTGEERYIRDAERMKKSALKFGYECHIEERKSNLNWAKACCLKPSYLLDMIDLYGKRPLIWLDCDGEIVRELKELEDPVFNTAICWLRGTNWCQSGTIYFDVRDPLTLNYLNEWNKECLRCINGEMPETWDQVILWNVWKDLTRIPITQILEQGYVKVFNHGWRKGSPQVEYVRHHQASREIRKVK